MDNLISDLRRLRNLSNGNSMRVCLRLDSAQRAPVPWAKVEGPLSLKLPKPDFPTCRRSGIPSASIASWRTLLRGYPKLPAWN